MTDRITRKHHKKLMAGWPTPNNDNKKESERMIRFEDLGAPYQEGDKWHVDEQLYPESRGYVQHDFTSEKEALQFIAKVVEETEAEKAQANQKTPLELLIEVEQKNAETICTLVECLRIYHDFFEDHERRIQNLEALLGE